MNSAAKGGGIAFTFNPVNETGISKTNVSKLNDGAAFGYDQVLTYDGYINTKVRLNKCLSSSRRHRSKRVNWKNKLCFSPKDVPGISGTVELSELIKLHW
jgi:hypothetical protein